MKVYVPEFNLRCKWHKRQRRQEMSASKLFSRKNRKYANSWPHSAIVIPPNLWGVSVRKLQIRNCHDSSVNCTRANFYKYWARIFCTDLNKSIICYICMEKRMYLWACGSFLSAKKLWFANHKLQIRKSQRRFGPQTANPRSALFEDGHLRIFFVELICGPPIFAQGWNAYWDVNVTVYIWEWS